MRFPDWLVYALFLGVILYVLLPSRTDSMAPEAPPVVTDAQGARALPPPSAFDERVLVQSDTPADGTGTAFSVSEAGAWLTARHVVDGCSRLALEVAPGTYVPVDPENVVLSPESDMAVLLTGRSPDGLPMVATEELSVGTQGFHVGFPQGQPGEVTSTLLSNSRLITRGVRRSEEQVLAWAEKGRTRGLVGSLAGLSGAPVFDALGRVVGVTVAESPRRGRIYTTSPDTLAAFLSEAGVEAKGTARPSRFTIEDYGREADRVRRALNVVKVVCKVG
jgi:S1-C subfamily serine protease